MNFTVDKQPQCRVNMRVDFSPDEVKTERGRVVDSFRKQARIPGYRPGKIPLPVVEKRFQKEIAEELEHRLVQLGCREGIKQQSLEVIAVTGIKDQAIDTNQAFGFMAELQVAPAFELPSYEGIPLEVAPVVVTDADVEQQMDFLRQRQSKFEDLDRPLQMGDFAIVDYSASLDGQPLDEAIEGTGFLAKGQGQWLRMAPDSFIPGFCAELEGLSAGAAKSFDLSVGEQFEVEVLRGKVLRYDVTVQAATRRVLPEWTDELAKTIGGEEETVDSLREKCRTRLTEVGKERQLEEMTTGVLEFLDKNVEFELPDRMVAHETQRQVNQIVNRIHQQGMSEEQITGQKDAIIKHASTQAEVNVKTSFILRQIAEKEQIEATQEEVAMYCVHLAESAGVSVNKYVRQLKKSDALEEIMDRIIRSKTLKLLRDKAKVTEVAPEPAAPAPAAE